MRSSFAYLGWIVGFSVVFAACGDGLGAPCYDRGETHECGPGEVCAKVFGELYCQVICDRHSDCGPDEHCGGVKDSSLNACRPDDDYYDDDDFDDGPPKPK